MLGFAKTVCPESIEGRSLTKKGMVAEGHSSLLSQL